MFNRFISLPVFIISLAIGLLFIYLSTPTSKAIYVYPTPDNTDIFEYVDRAYNCFTFDHNKVDCPKNKTMIKQIPVQK